MKITVLLISLSIIIFFLLFAHKSYSKKKIESLTGNQDIRLYIENFVDFQIFDNKGNNVLDPKYNFHFTIDVLICVNGKIIAYNDPTKMASKGYLINNNDYSIRLYLSEPKNGSNISETILRLDEKEEFVFKTEFEGQNNSLSSELGGGSYQRKKIWLNDTLFWDRDSISNAFPQLIVNRD